MKRKKSGKHIFQLKDKVRIRDPASGVWNKMGIIEDVISSQDGVVRSFMIRLDSVRIWSNIGLGLAT